MFNFQYHIPSAMSEGKWGWIQHEFNLDRDVASRAVMTHFRGSDYPAEVEIWVRRAKKRNGKQVVRKFRCVEDGRMVYVVHALKEETV